MPNIPMSISSACLQKVSLRLQQQTSGTVATGIHRLIANRNRSRVQIETISVMRGTVHPVRTMRVRPGVNREFGFAEMQVLDSADLDAGKLSAALPRQHPRDLFDMQPLLDGDNLDAKLWRTFLVYFTCSPKPAAEMLAPNEPRDFEQTFATHFQGMTAAPVTAASLLDGEETTAQVSPAASEFLPVLPNRRR